MKFAHDLIVKSYVLVKIYPKFRLYRQSKKRTIRILFKPSGCPAGRLIN